MKNKINPTELREMLALLREYGTPEETLRSVVLNAARDMGIPVDGPRLRNPAVADFFEEWKNKTVPLPFIPCNSQDLYLAFQVWCSLHEETPGTMAAFGRDIVTLGIKKFHTRIGAIVDPLGDLSGAVEQSAADFRKCLAAYQKASGKK